MLRYMYFFAAVSFAFQAISSDGVAATLQWTEITYQNTGGGPFTSNNGAQGDVGANPPAELLSVTTSAGTLTNLVFAESTTYSPNGQNIVGNDLSTGLANPAGSFDVAFERSPNDIGDDYLLLTDFGGTDTFTAQLLDDNGPISDQLTISSNWTDIANNSAVGNNDIKGALVELMDFFAVAPLVPASDIVGVRIDQTGTGSGNRLDPLVIGLATLNAAVVPEPASIAIWSLIGLGLAGFGYRRVRRKK